MEERTFLRTEDYNIVTEIYSNNTLATFATLAAGVVALLMWNMPGLIVQTTCGVLVTSFIDPDSPPFYLAGLAPAAIALLFKAAYGFSGQLDRCGAMMALCSCVVSVIIAGDEVIDKGVCQWVYPLLLVLGSLFCLVDSKREVRINAERIDNFSFN